MRLPSINWPSHFNGIVDSILAALIFTLANLRRVVSHFIAMACHSLIAWTTHRRYVLIWNDADITYSEKLIIALNPGLSNCRLYALQSPSGLHNFHLGPSVVSAVILIDTDVSKFSADPRESDRIERSLTRFLMRGGGIIGTHDVIYSRVRNQQLQAAFGGKISEFRKVTLPVRYTRTQAGRSHPLSASLPDSFELEDGEMIWGEWYKDCTIHYEAILNKSYPLVVSRQYLNGRLVWTHSGDKGSTLAKSVAEPQIAFSRLLLHAVLWVSRSNESDYEKTRQIVAHRGASLLCFENTIQAFLKAINLGADYAELDIRKSNDGILLVHHDLAVNGKKISEHTFKELQASARQAGYELAALGDVLAVCKGRIKLDVELKEEGYEREVLEQIRQVLADGDFVITSFFDQSLRKVKLLASNVRCGLLLGKDTSDHLIKTRISELFPVSRVLVIGADFVAPHYRLLRLGFSKRLRSRGIPVWVWTVDDPVLMRKVFSDRSVEAVITNAPDLALFERKRLTAGRP